MVIREIKQDLETHDNGDMMTENLWDATKAVLRGKFIAIQSHLKRQEILYLKQLGKEE